MHVRMRVNRRGGVLLVGYFSILFIRGFLEWKVEGDADLVMFWC